MQQFRLIMNRFTKNSVNVLNGNVHSTSNLVRIAFLLSVKSRAVTKLSKQAISLWVTVRFMIAMLIHTMLFLSQ